MANVIALVIALISLLVFAHFSKESDSKRVSGDSDSQVGMTML